MVAARNVKWLPREISEDSEGRLQEGIQVLTEAFVVGPLLAVKVRLFAD